jgi:hypothetical protein
MIVFDYASLLEASLATDDIASNVPPPSAYNDDADFDTGSNMAPLSPASFFNWSTYAQNEHNDANDENILEVQSRSPFNNITYVPMHATTSQAAQNPLYEYLFVPFDHMDHAHNNDYEFNLMLEEIIGNVEVGVDDIDQVAPVLLASEYHALQSEMSCPICQEAMQGCVIIRRTLCNHYFCDACISTWFATHKKCPICMQDVQDMLELRNENEDDPCPETDEYESLSSDPES